MARETSRQIWDFWIDRGGTFTDVVGCRPDGSLVGVYLWKSRERAEATHDHHWMQTVLARRGVLPLVEYKDVHMILDNEKGTVTEF